VNVEDCGDGDEDGKQSIETDAALRKPSTLTLEDQQGVTDKSIIHWNTPSSDDEEYKRGVRIVIQHQFEITQIAWHKRGDYFASLAPGGTTFAIIQVNYNLN
jgi:WD40 repeat protein